jgi:uncharacterized membrane protein YdjX (TVP38/TMEM64 family)
LNRLGPWSGLKGVIDQLRSLVDASGPFGPPVFVVAYVALTLALVPGTIPSLAAGALFGPVLGSVLTVVGATLGAVGAFEIARRLGRERTRRFVGDRVLRADERIGRHGTSAVLGLRLMPVAPFNVLNYAFGLSSVGRVKDHGNSPPSIMRIPQVVGRSEGRR